jgi:Collagen triple helix repeat (20 copies)
MITIGDVMRRQIVVLTAFASGLVGAVGCDSSGSPSEQPVNGVYAVALMASTTAGLPKCTSALSGSVAYVTSSSTLWACSSGNWCQIMCASSEAGDVAYASSTQTLLACVGSKWTQVVLPAGPQGARGSTGPAGPKGDAGAVGPAGPQGAQGSAGPQGAAGPTGPAGLRGDAGVPGPAGPQGPAGAAGAESLISVTTEPPGPNCAAGGERIDVGIDTNGDGTLESSEIQKTAYVCNGSSSATTVSDAGRDAGATDASATATQPMICRGGSVLSNVVVAPIYYSDFDRAVEVTSLWSTILGSGYTNWLVEYNTTFAGGTNQIIGQGSVLPATVLAGAAPSTLSITDLETAFIQSLESSTAPFPLPTPNTFYVLYVGASTLVTGAVGTTLCVDNTYERLVSNINGTSVQWAVVGLCPNTRFGDNLPYGSSAALLDALTDPHFDAWETNAGSDIAERCLNETDPHASYFLARGWSNAAGGCR